MKIPEPILRDLEKIGGVKGLIERLPKNKKIEDASKIFHGLSDPVRLKILMILNARPVCVCIIKEIIGIADSKLSYHLSTLKECGLINGERKGNWIIYYPTDLGKEISKFLQG